MDPQLVLVQRDVQLLGAFPHELRALLQPREPGLGVAALQVVRHGSGNQRESLFRMVEEPTGRDDLATGGQRHGGIERLQGERETKVFRDLHLGDLAELRLKGRGQLGFLSPGRQRTCEKQLPGLVPGPSLGGRQRELRRARVGLAGETQAPTKARLPVGTARGRRRRRVAGQPLTHLVPAPALVTIACEESPEQHVHPRVQVLGDRGAVGQDMDQEGLVVDPFEASPARDLFEEHHAQAPPVARRRDPAGDRFRRGVSGGLEGRDNVEVEIGQARRAEAGDHQIERVAGADKDRARLEVSVP